MSQHLCKLKKSVLLKEEDLVFSQTQRWVGDVPNDVKDLDATKALSLELDKPFLKDKKKRSHKLTFSKSQQDALVREIMQEVKKNDSRNYQPSGI
jgi:hypothetical protein